MAPHLWFFAKDTVKKYPEKPLVVMMAD
jgi:hypothetical protein